MNSLAARATPLVLSCRAWANQRDIGNLSRNKSSDYRDRLLIFISNPPDKFDSTGWVCTALPLCVITTVN